MADSYLDHIPTHERQKLRRMMSPEAYEKLRERVKGPEDLEHEMERNKQMADVSFLLESEPALHETLKANVERDIREKGMETVLEGTPSEEAKAALEHGKFMLKVSTHPKTHLDQLVIVPEGKVQEKLPFKASLNEAYCAQLLARRP